METCN